MDFFIGLIVGIVVTILIGGTAAYFFLRDTAKLLVPAPNPVANPAVTVILIEPFLNQQLREVLASQPLPVQTDAASPFKLQVNNVALDVLPEARAEFITQLTVTAWNFKLNVRPVAELAFVAETGRVRIFVSRVHLGGITVPRVLIDRLVNEIVASAEAKLNYTLSQFQNETHIRIAALETTNEWMILKFK